MTFGVRRCILHPALASCVLPIGGVDPHVALQRLQR